MYLHSGHHCVEGLPDAPSVRAHQIPDPPDAQLAQLRHVRLAHGGHLILLISCCRGVLLVAAPFVAIPTPAYAHDGDDERRSSTNTLPRYSSYPLLLIVQSGFLKFSCTYCTGTTTVRTAVVGHGRSRERGRRTTSRLVISPPVENVCFEYVVRRRTSGLKK